MSYRQQIGVSGLCSLEAKYATYFREYLIQINPHLDSNEVVCLIEDPDGNPVFFESTTMSLKRTFYYSFTIDKLKIKIGLRVDRKVRTDLSKPMVTIKKMIATIRAS